MEPVTIKERSARWGRRFAVIYSLTVLLGLAAFFADLWIFNTRHPTGPLAWALGAVPGVLTCGGLYWLWRALVPIDEFQGKYMRDAVFATLTLGFGVMVIWGGISAFAKVPFPGAYVFAIYAFCWAICAPYTAWKHNR